LWFSRVPTGKCYNFLPHPLQFILHYHSIIRQFIIWHTDIVIKSTANKQMVPTLWRNLGHPSSTLKMEVSGSSKKLVSIYQTIRCHIPEKRNLQGLLCTCWTCPSFNISF
jgi:hypothetical protein